MPDDTPLHALILTTLLPADLEALCVALRAFATVAGGDAVHVALLTEPLDVATLQGWLAAEGHPLQAPVVVAEGASAYTPTRRARPPTA